MSERNEEILICFRRPMRASREAAQSAAFCALEFARDEMDRKPGVWNGVIYRYTGGLCIHCHWTRTRAISVVLWEEVPHAS